MDKLIEQVKALSTENDELSEAVSSLSKNCGTLSDQITKLRQLNNRYTKENATLKSSVDEMADKWRVHSQDMKYVMEKLAKLIAENRELKLKVKSLNEMNAWRRKQDEIDRKSLAAFENEELRSIIREKEKLIDELSGLKIVKWNNSTGTILKILNV